MVNSLPKPRSLNVKAHPDVEQDRIAFWDVDADYPNGEVFVAQDGHVVEAVATTRLMQAIAGRRLVETTDAPTRPSGPFPQDPNQPQQEPLPEVSRTPNPLSQPQNQYGPPTLPDPGAPVQTAADLPADATVDDTSAKKK